jgi:two-component system NtrC family sensor kinase
MPDEGPSPNQPDLPSNRLEHEESQLWRWALGLLVLLAAAVAALSWQQLKDLPYQLWAIPAGLFLLALLFATYAFGRKREVSELNRILKGFQSQGAAGAGPSEDQLDQLGQLIMRSQRSFKELIDSLEDVALAISLDGTVRTVNRRTTEILGVSYNQLVGHKLEDFLGAPLRAEASTNLARFLEKRTWSGVIEVHLKNDSRRLFYDCVINAIIKGDDVVGASVLARDITGHREKEQRFTQLFESLQEGVYISDPEGHLLEVNPALVKILGYDSKDDLLRLPPEQLSVDEKPVLGLGGNQSGNTRTREVRLKRKDGGVAVCVDTSTGVIDTGRVVRYQGTLVDVTEQRALEQQLRRQEEFRRHLLESFPDLILVLDLKGQYTFVSARIAELLGYGPEQLMGKSIDDAKWTPPDLAALYRTVATGQNSLTSCDYDALHRDGTSRTMLGMASPMLDAEGKLAGVIISVRDVTKEKKLEQQIIQSERLAAMGQMIGGFAHELNNPLTVILGNSELLQELEVSDPARKPIAALRQEARRAADIVQNLQYFARPPAPGHTQVNLNELVQRTVQMQAYPMRKSNITVDFVPDPSIPAIMADPNQLMQVFLNLLLNAEQAIRESATQAGNDKDKDKDRGGDKNKGKIRVRIARKADSVSIVFQDDGPGIAPETLPHIFDPFFTTRRPGRGTGLGLSICKTVLREHRGNIEAAPGPDGGAVFTITLPIAAAESAAAAK